MQELITSINSINHRLPLGGESESFDDEPGAADLQLATCVGLANGVAGKKGVPAAESVPPLLLSSLLPPTSSLLITFAPRP
mmetsp:Transcript_5412/g.8046  ORF Transcript_5412/g.8046 Transcript_5412/m.8046 type:complete len:81 (+) Transcript_5412:76-318(+)